MKRLAVIVMICVMVGSCQKENDGALVFELQHNPSWTAESFKTFYTIQFPAGYTGQMNGFEGNIFDKRNTDSSRVWYSYCNPLHCFDFNDTLNDPSQNSMQAVFNQTTTVQLSGKINFTSNGELVGVFYHSNDPYSYGRLFWKDDGVYKEAADASYRVENLQQVVDVFRTIKHN